MGVRNRTITVIDRINDIIGNMVCWLVLAMVLLTSINVFQRYILQSNAIWQTELVLFMHSLVFLGAAGYTLKRNKHVRVDVMYERFSDQAKRRINVLGTLLLLMPVCVALLYFSYDYVKNAWDIKEGSREAGGMPGIFVLKSFMWLFAFTLLIQGVSFLLKSRSSK